jgi:hypothetical protein
MKEYIIGYVSRDGFTRYRYYNAESKMWDWTSDESMAATYLIHTVKIALDHLQYRDTVKIICVGEVKRS